MGTVTVRRPVENPKHAALIQGPISIGAATTYNDETKQHELISFKDSMGRDSTFDMPEGGEIVVDDSVDYQRDNIALLEKMKLQGVLPFPLIIERATERVIKNNTLREKRMESYNRVKAITDDTDAVKSLAVRLGLFVTDNLTLGDIIGSIYELGDSEPERVLRELDNQDAGLFMLVHEAKNKLILTMAPQGGMYFQNQSLGYNELEAVSILKSNPALLAGIQNALSARTIPSRTAPQANLDDAIEEQLRLDELKDSLLGQNKVLTVEQIIEFGMSQKIGLIKTVGTGPGGKSTKYIYKGFEIGKTLEEVALYLEDNPAEYDLLRKLAQ